MLAVFSDRTAASWDVNRVAELQSMRDRVPPPSVLPRLRRCRGGQAGEHGHHHPGDEAADRPGQPAGDPVRDRRGDRRAERTTSCIFSVDGEEAQRRPVNPGPGPAGHACIPQGRAEAGAAPREAQPGHRRRPAVRQREVRHLPGPRAAARARPGGLRRADRSSPGRPLGGGDRRARPSCGRRPWTPSGWYACDVRPVGESERDRIRAGTRRSPCSTWPSQADALWTKLAGYVGARRDRHRHAPPAGQRGRGRPTSRSGQPGAAAAVHPLAGASGQRAGRLGVAGPGPNRPFLTKFRESLEQLDFLRDRRGSPDHPRVLEGRRRAPRPGGRGVQRRPGAGPAVPGRARARVRAPRQGALSSPSRSAAGRSGSTTTRPPGGSTWSW